MSEQNGKSKEREKTVIRKLGEGIDSIVYKYTYNPQTPQKLVGAFKEFHGHKYELREKEILEKYFKLHEILSGPTYHIILQKPIVVEHENSGYAASDFTFEFLKLAPQKVTMASSMKTKKEIIYADIPYVEGKTLNNFICSFD